MHPINLATMSVETLRLVADHYRGLAWVVEQLAQSKEFAGQGNEYGRVELLEEACRTNATLPEDWRFAESDMA